MNSQKLDKEKDDKCSKPNVNSRKRLLGGNKRAVLEKRLIWERGVISKLYCQSFGKQLWQKIFSSEFKLTTTDSSKIAN